MNHKILLVDDNPIQAMTRRMILEKVGHSVIVAENGAQGLEIFRSAAVQSIVHTSVQSPFCLVISDHLMPEMNGPEFVQALREMGVTTPILVLSGLPDAEAEYEGLDVTFRLKPLAPDALIALTSEISLAPMSRIA